MSHSAIHGNLEREGEEARQRAIDNYIDIKRERPGRSWTPLRRGCGLDDYTATDDVSGGSLPQREHKHTAHIFIDTVL